MASSSSSKRSKDSLRMVFARNIRAMRILQGISQEALANLAGLDRAFVGTLERFQRNISVDGIEKIAKALGVPAHQLMDPELSFWWPEVDLTLTRAKRTPRVATKKSANRKRRA